MRRSVISGKLVIEIPTQAKISICRIGSSDGYDGHSLRAYAYFKEQMPDILQAEGRRVFEVQQDGQIFYLFEGDEIITSDGQTTTIEAYQSRMKQLERAA